MQQSIEDLAGSPPSRIGATSPHALETFDGPNVAFYGRRGYVVLSRDRSPIAPEAVVAMLRPAAASIEPTR